ncbi:MAG: branched-chain amino acid transport system substrate-binding protein [Syntrophaceae bacterium]|nr:MAG: branched-chain amino acid transport system substrate-binding protein [Syntrophaceae bacterium]
MKHLKRFILWSTISILFFWTSLGVAGEIIIGYSGPISGFAAEYGQDIFNGIDMAVKEINEEGGITVAGKKYTFKLEKLDDRADPTQATNNARRFQAAGAIAVFNGVFTTTVPIMKINEEKGKEFLMMAYTSTPKVEALGNKLTIISTPTFSVYVEVFTDWALKKGWKTCAMVVTFGGYGDEWSQAFRESWEKKGGVITMSKPANYYMETDFSAPLTAAIATKPDCMLIGGPSATTALVIEQARQMGFKGGFIMIDQAKQDIIAKLLGSTKIMGDLIGTGGVLSLPASPYAERPFDSRYTKAYKRMTTWECVLNYTAVHSLARAITAAGTATDAYKIRAAFPKAYPMLADKFPSEFMGITAGGRVKIYGTVQTITKGVSDPSFLSCWWPKSQAEFDVILKMSKVNEKVNKILVPVPY